MTEEEFKMATEKFYKMIMRVKNLEDEKCIYALRRRYGEMLKEKLLPLNSEEEVDEFIKKWEKIIINSLERQKSDEYQIMRIIGDSTLNRSRLK